MADLTNMTARQLADYYFELTGKTLKPSSYSKAKIIELIEAVTGDDTFRQRANEVMKVKKEAREELAKIKQIEDDNSLGCGGEFGPELETTFTLTEAAASIGISPKVARARYRMIDNDGKRTRYEFPRSDWDRVISVISPKRKAR